MSARSNDRLLYDINASMLGLNIVKHLRSQADTNNGCQSWPGIACSRIGCCMVATAGSYVIFQINPDMVVPAAKQP